MNERVLWVVIALLAGALGAYIVGVWVRQSGTNLAGSVGVGIGVFLGAAALILTVVSFLDRPKTGRTSPSTADPDEPTALDEPK